MRRIAGEPRQLQIDQAERDLRRGHGDPEHQRPPRGDRARSAPPAARRSRSRCSITPAACCSSMAPFIGRLRSLRDRPVQQRQRVGLVVVGRREAEPADGVDHRLLVGVALAGDVPLDRADRDALVRDAVRLGPGGEMGEVSSVGVAGGGAEMAPHFFEHDDADAARRFVDLLQPARGSAARSSRRPRTGRGGTPGRRWRSRRRGCARPSRCAGPDRGRGSPVSSACRRRAPRSAPVPQRLHRLQFRQSHRSHGNLHRVVVVRAVASPAKAVATVRFAQFRCSSGIRPAAAKTCRSTGRG